MNDTEALKALVAKWRGAAKEVHEESGAIRTAAAVRICARDLEIELERMLASQTQTADELPFMPTTNAAKPTADMVDEALDGFNTMPATEGLRAQVEHAVERAMWACAVFAPPSKSVWALVDKWRQRSGEEGLHYVLKNALLNHAIELDEALAAAPVASQMGDENTVTLDKRDLFDFVRGEIKQALDETDTFTESEKWEEAHQRTEDCLGRLYAAPAAGMDADKIARDIVETYICTKRAENYQSSVAEIAAIIRKHVP